MDARGLPIQEFEPAAGLAAHVARYWGASVGADTRGGARALHTDGCITLISQASANGTTRGVLVGPRDEPVLLPVVTGDRLWGIRCWPDTGGILLGRNPEDIAGHVVSPVASPPWLVSLLQALGGCADRAAASEIADLLLAPAVSSAGAPDHAVRRAVQALVATHGEMAIADVAAGVGISLRQLERRFLAAVGLNPVQYARVRKMRGEALPLLGGTELTWEAIAESLGSARP